VLTALAPPQHRSLGGDVPPVQQAVPADAHPRLVAQPGLASAAELPLLARAPAGTGASTFVRCLGLRHATGALTPHRVTVRPGTCGTRTMPSAGSRAGRPRSSLASGTARRRSFFRRSRSSSTSSRASRGHQPPARRSPGCSFPPKLVPTLVADGLLPHRYTIFVVLWTCVPRPRKGAGSSSHTASTIPDLSWVSSHDPAADDASTSAGCGGPLSVSIGRFCSNGFFTKSGRRDWRVSHAEAKARHSKGWTGQRSKGEVKKYTIDLRADEEAAGGRASRQASLMFADDGGDAHGDKKRDDDEVADWREGIMIREAQSVRVRVAQCPDFRLLTRTCLPISTLPRAQPHNSYRRSSVIGPRYPHQRFARQRQRTTTFFPKRHRRGHTTRPLRHRRRLSARCRCCRAGMARSIKG
jgi:hypothetical protein